MPFWAICFKLFSSFSIPQEIFTAIADVLISVSILWAWGCIISVIVLYPHFFSKWYFNIFSKISIVKQVGKTKNDADVHPLLRE